MYMYTMHVARSIYWYMYIFEFACIYMYEGVPHCFVLKAAGPIAYCLLECIPHLLCLYSFCYGLLGISGT